MLDDSRENGRSAEAAAIVRSALWSAYGDALGFISELTDPGGLRQRIRRDWVDETLPWRRNIGGQFGANVPLLSGCYSDDTQLRLATSRAIRSDGYFDVEAFAKIELPVWLCYALGAGRSTRAAAAQLTRRDVNWFSNFFDGKGQKYESAGGNGAAMRIQPHIWAAKDKADLQKIGDDVIKNSICTHGHMRAIVGALFHGFCVAFAIRNRELPDPRQLMELCASSIEVTSSVVHRNDDLRSFWLPVWEKRSGIRLLDSLNRVKNECFEDLKIGQIFVSDSNFNYNEFVKKLGGLDERARGSGTKTAIIAAVLSWVYKDQQPSHAIRVAANLLGSDTDTIASMSGAILGCVAQSEPAADVLDRDYITHQAKRLFHVGIGDRVEDFDYPDVMHWSPPQNQLEAVRQEDGFVVMGLGPARPSGDSFEARGKQEAVWQWLKLELGQTILAKRRRNPRSMMPSNAVPSVKQFPERISTKNVAQLQDSIETTEPELFSWQPSSEQSVPGAVQESPSVDKMTSEVIRSGFDEKLIGEYLLRLAEGDRGIELAVAFASIIAKARKARFVRQRG